MLKDSEEIIKRRRLSFTRLSATTATTTASAVTATAAAQAAQAAAAAALTAAAAAAAASVLTPIETTKLMGEIHNVDDDDDDDIRNGNAMARIDDIDATTTPTTTPTTTTTDATELTITTAMATTVATATTQPPKTPTTGPTAPPPPPPSSFSSMLMMATSSMIGSINGNHSCSSNNNNNMEHAPAKTTTPTTTKPSAAATTTAAGAGAGEVEAATRIGSVHTIGGGNASTTAIELPDHYSLRWNNHQNHILRAFDALLQTKALVDVTLVCAEKSIHAHKMVLSACSPFFARVFAETPCKHPVIVLKDFQGWVVQAIVDFMYRGEISVPQERLQTLIQAGESLQVRGLVESSVPKHTPTPAASPEAFGLIDTSALLSSTLGTAANVDLAEQSSGSCGSNGSAAGGDESFEDDSPPSMVSAGSKVILPSRLFGASVRRNERERERKRERDRERKQTELERNSLDFESDQETSLTTDLMPLDPATMSAGCGGVALSSSSTADLLCTSPMPRRKQARPRRRSGDMPLELANAISPSSPATTQPPLTLPPLPLTLPLPPTTSSTSTSASLPQQLQCVLPAVALEAPALAEMAAAAAVAAEQLEALKTVIKSEMLLERMQEEAALAASAEVDAAAAVAAAAAAAAVAAMDAEAAAEAVAVGQADSDDVIALPPTTIPTASTDLHEDSGNGNDSHEQRTLNSSGDISDEAREPQLNQSKSTCETDESRTGADAESRDRPSLSTQENNNNNHNKTNNNKEAAISSSKSSRGSTNANGSGDGECAEGGADIMALTKRPRLDAAIGDNDSLEQQKEPKVKDDVEEKRKRKDRISNVLDEENDHEDIDDDDNDNDDDDDDDVIQIPTSLQHQQHPLAHLAHLPHVLTHPHLPTHRLHQHHQHHHHHLNHNASGNNAMPEAEDIEDLIQAANGELERRRGRRKSLNCSPDVDDEEPNDHDDHFDRDEEDEDDEDEDDNVPEDLCTTKKSNNDSTGHQSTSRASASAASDVECSPTNNNNNNNSKLSNNNNNSNNNKNNNGGSNRIVLSLKDIRQLNKPSSSSTPNSCSGGSAGGGGGSGSGNGGNSNTGLHPFATASLRDLRIDRAALENHCKMEALEAQMHAAAAAAAAAAASGENPFQHIEHQMDLSLAAAAAAAAVSQHSRDHPMLQREHHHHLHHHQQQQHANAYANSILGQMGLPPHFGPPPPPPLPPPPPGSMGNQQQPPPPPSSSASSLSLSLPPPPHGPSAHERLEESMNRLSKDFAPSSPMSLPSHFNLPDGPPHPPSPLPFPGMSSALALTPPHIFGLDSPLGLFPPGIDPGKLYNPLMEMSDPRGLGPEPPPPPFLKGKKVPRPKGQHSAPRGGPPRSWTNSELTEALAHVWNKKMTTSQASRIFGIPYNSLLMYVRGKYGKSLKLEQLRKDCISGPPLELLQMGISTHSSSSSSSRKRKNQHSNSHGGGGNGGSGGGGPGGPDGPGGLGGLAGLEGMDIHGKDGRGGSNSADLDLSIPLPPGLMGPGGLGVCPRSASSEPDLLGGPNSLFNPFPPGFYPDFPGGFPGLPLSMLNLLPPGDRHGLPPGGSFAALHHLGLDEDCKSDRSKQSLDDDFGNSILAGGLPPQGLIMPPRDESQQQQQRNTGGINVPSTQQNGSGVAPGVGAGGGGTQD